MSRYFVLLRDWKINVKTVIGIVCMLCIIFMLPGPVASQYQISLSEPWAPAIEEIPSSDRPIQLQTGDKQKFTIMAEKMTKVAKTTRINYIEFTTMELEGKPKPKKHGWWGSKPLKECGILSNCKKLEHSITYSWSEPGVYKVSAKVGFKFQSNALWDANDVRERVWTVEVISTEPPEPVELPDPPSIRISPSIKDSYTLIQGLDPMKWYTYVNDSYYILVGESMEFRIQAISKDGIASITFTDNEHRPVRKDQFDKPKSRSFLWNPPSSTVVYRWESAGTKKVTAKVVTELGALEEVEWTIEVGNPRPADLVVKSATVNKSTLTPGGNFKLSATVRNQGTEKLGSISLSYYRSSDTNISRDDTKVGTDGVKDLDGGRTRKHSINLKAPDSPGTYYYYACVYSIWEQSNKDNNCSEVIAITVPAPHLPDLIVESISASKVSLDPGEEFTLYARVRNQGTSKSYSTWLRYHGPGGHEIGKNRVDRLSSTVVSNQNIDLEAPDEVGTYYYEACVDGVSNESEVYNNCSTRIAITVGQTAQNRSPSAVGRTPVQMLTANTAARHVDVSIYFHDPDGNRLTYTARSDNMNVATASASGDEVRITPRVAGSATVTVTASDGSFTATQRFSVTVRDASVRNQAPVAVGIIPVQSMTVGAAGAVQVSGYFSDLNGDSLTYTAVSGNTNVVTTRVSGAYLTITPVRVGGATVTVTASDGALSTTQSISVTVASTPPQPDPTSFDLAIQSVTVSKDTLVPGESFTLFVAIRNNGPGTSGAPSLSYYHSSIQGRSPTDPPQLQGAVWLDSLASGESITKVITLSAPSTPRSYYYGAWLSANNGDTNLYNDVATEVDVTVTARPNQVSKSPDLVIESVSVDKSTLAPGEDFQLETVVGNQGEVDAPSTYLRYYRSSDAAFSGDDTEVGDDRITTPGAGETYDRSERLTAPDKPGVYYYIACVDGMQGESNTVNNCSEAIRVSVQTIFSPDLAIASISTNKVSLDPDESFQLTVVVWNQGGGGSRSTKLRYYLSSDATFSGDDTEVNTRNVRSLEADERSEGSKTLRVPETPGVYYYIACVDGVQGEIRTDNNCSIAVKMTVQAPDLVVESVSVSNTTLKPGERFTLSASVRNQGTGGSYSTMLSYRGPEGDEIGRDRIEVLYAAEVSDQDIDLEAPDQAGTYNYEVCVGSVQDESDVSNNCATAIAITVIDVTDLGICDRTPQVLNEILAELDIDDCTEVGSEDLNTITSLGLHDAGITTLKEYDFQGLTGLDDLDLSDNSLSSLPVGVFNGLTALFSLELYNNSLSSLPVGIFTQLGALDSLNLAGNSLGSLSVGVFDGLSLLRSLDLEENSLGSLPVDIFDELSSLRKLDLKDNSLRSLPVGAFNGLNTLDTLDLRENSLSSLPAEVFDGLNALEYLDLQENSLSSLPAGVFDGLSALEYLDLEDNQLTTLPVGIFDDVLDTLKSTSLDLDASLKTTFGFSTTAQDAAEGETVRVVVSLGHALPVAVRVPYTVGGTATAADYTNLQTPTELLFLAGETSKEIVFTLLEDADTTAETVLLTLGERKDVKLRKSDGSGPDAKLSAYTLLNSSQQRVHTVTVTTGGGGVSRPMYWTGGDNKIRRSKMDGTLVQVLVLLDDGNPADIALDISGGRMYWVDSYLDGIRRANLDGSGVINLVTDLGSPTGLALDISGGKIYWLDYHFDKIQRANLNGSGIEDLVTGLDKPLGIALDVSGGKMYWTDTGTDKIHRANLNGTNVEDLVTGLSNPTAIALDVSGGKMYWVDSSTNKIQRANLNGTNIEDLVTNFDIGADGLALDVSGGKMYWADNQEDKICRANLDGSQIERLYAGGYPIGIALAVGSGAAANAAPSAVNTNLVPRSPSETALLPNYPNPFNPETWLPYQLLEASDVTVRIYSVNGSLIRTLALGHQAAGLYRSRSRAAYWDGRNAFGERVASGLYFYTLTAGDFTATRKMLIRK